LSLSRRKGGGKGEVRGKKYEAKVGKVRKGKDMIY